MLKTNAETILVSGSANCSQAALLATRGWGNAELVTIEAIDGSEEGDFWDGLQKLDKSVELPQSAPSTEWESFEEPDIRILSARKDGDTLRVHYKAKQVPKQIFVTLNGNEKNILASEQADGLAVFDVSVKATTLILHAVFDEGVHVGSNPSWIDDEQSLRTDGPERRIREKLEDMAVRGSSSTRDFFDLFNLYDGHIRKPVAFGRRNSGLLPTENTSIVEFSEDEVFSDGFATPPPLSGDRGVTATGPVDTFTVFVAFFNTKSQSPPPRRSLNQSPAQIPETENEDAPPSEVQDVVATEPDEQVQRKFTRALASIERGMSQKDFVTSRPPERLSSDLGLWALLLVKARFHEHIRLNPEEFRNHILKVMRLLFLGSNNAYGSIREHLRSLPEDAAQQFSNAMASPKLTAALSLLFMLDWENSDTEARELRFAAARLGTLYPWLPRGGSKEEIFADIDQIALTILPDGYRTKLFSLWGQWIADSHALERFAESLKRHKQKELGDICPDRQLHSGELCWQTGHEYCTVDENCFRRAKNKIALTAIDSGKSLSVQAHFVAPVSDLLKKPIIMVSDQVRQQVFSVLSGVGLSQEASM